MTGVYLAYVLSFIIVNAVWRAGIADAMDYKKNKKRRREYKKETPFIRRILRIYPVKDCSAPRHLKIYYFFRAFNALVMIIALITLPSENAPGRYDLLIHYIVYAAILFLPIIPEMIYQIIFGKYGGKPTDFSIYKKP